MKLSLALANCRVFVPLYSPRYFGSEQCGREWSAFAGRAADMSVRGAVGVEAIIPALWVPVRPEQLPEAARSIHYLFGDYGGAYATHGFYRLMRLSKYQDDYEEAVYELACRIRDVAEGSPVGPGPAVKYESLVNAFGRDGERVQEDSWRRAINIHRNLSEQWPKSAAIACSVPARNAEFTGRDHLLGNIREQLDTASRAVALLGPGGVGKTQAAVEYAHRYMAEYDIVWRVSAEQRDLVNPALAELTGHLGLRVSDSITDNAQAVREALRQGSPSARWLLIFDNADDPDDLTPFFPGGPGHVLVTSRNPEWSRVADVVEIDVFARAESQEYLQRRVPPLSNQDAGILAEVLGDLPLAIEHASAWLTETGMPAAGYVARLNDEFNAAEPVSEPLGYPPSVAATLRLSFDRLRERWPAAARLLELCAYFAPDPISLSLIYSDEMTTALLPYDRRLRERDVMSKLLRDIERYSLAKMDRGSNSIQLHRLIQYGIRAQLAPERDRDEVKHEVHKILVGARPKQGNTDDPENWARYDLIWPHLGPSAAYRCDSPDTRQLLIDMVRYLWKRGEFKAALEVGERLEEQWSGTIGPHDRQTLYLRFHIANVLRSQGRFQEAHDLDTEVFVAQAEMLGDDDPNTLQTAGSLGGDLRALGRFRDALDMDARTYGQIRDMLGADHPSALSAANNLAIDLRLVGDCFRARDIDLDTLSLRERVLGADHPNTLHSASMLARDLRESGDYGWSAELLSETHRRYRTVLGEDHVSTLQTGKNLAVTLRKMGRYDEAYELTRDAAARLEDNYGVNHPETLACRLNLACDLSARGDKDKAYVIARKVLLAYQQAMGARHPFSLAVQSNIATYLRGRGSGQGALTLASRTLSALTAVLGEDHPFALSCAVNRANCLYDEGQLTAAEGLLRETRERLKKTFGDHHPDTLICEGNLAVTLHVLGRADEADRLRRQLIGEMGQALGQEHPSIANLRAWRLHNRDLEVQPT